MSNKVCENCKNWNIKASDEVQSTSMGICECFNVNEKIYISLFDIYDYLDLKKNNINEIDKIRDMLRIRTKNNFGCIYYEENKLSI